MTYMLDTNICIYAIKNKPEQVLRQLHAHLDDGMCISSITLAELAHGVRKSLYPEKNEEALLQFLSILDILDFAASEAAERSDITCVTSQWQRRLLVTFLRSHNFKKRTLWESEMTPRSTLLR